MKRLTHVSDAPTLDSLAAALNVRQLAFANGVLAKKSATESYIDAGYSEKGAEVSASQLLRNPKVAKYIASAKSKAAASAVNLHHRAKASLPQGYIGLRIPNAVATALIAQLGSDHNGEVERYVLRLIQRELVANGASLSVIGRNPIDSTTRYATFERAGFKCQACGDRPNPLNDVQLHIDHIVPLSCGGGDDAGNLQVLCSACNISKGNRHAHDHNLDLCEN